MSILNTYTSENMIIETRDCGDGVISIKTYYLNEKKERFVERIIQPSGQIIINTTGIKQQILTPKVSKAKPITERKKKVKIPTTEEQIIRTGLLKKILVLQKKHDTIYPKKDEYVNKSNDELVLVIDTIINNYTTPLEFELNKILLFKKEHQLRAPLKKLYANYSINELEVLLLNLQQQQQIKRNKLLLDGMLK